MISEAFAGSAVRMFVWMTISHRMIKIKALRRRRGLY